MVTSGAGETRIRTFRILSSGPLPIGIQHQSNPLRTELDLIVTKSWKFQDIFFC